MPYLSSASVAATSDTLECGEFGTYGEQLKRTGDGKYHRDHIPSKAALKERARELNGGYDLSPAQAKAIDNGALAVCIPASAHREVSPTYGGRNSTSQIQSDSKDLACSARRDTAAMKKKINNYADEECQEYYKAAADEIDKMTNKDYDKFLQNILDTVP